MSDEHQTDEFGEPIFNGIFRGLAMSSSDPELRGRVLVAVPQINGNSPVAWAMPCFPFLVPSPDQTAIRLPLSGEPLWVMFENGSPSNPVWLGTWKVAR